VPKQSQREESFMRLLRFARNDMEARIRYATFWIASVPYLSEREQSFLENPADEGQFYLIFGNRPEANISYVG